MQKRAPKSKRICSSFKYTAPGVNMRSGHMLLCLLSPDLQQFRIKPELAPILVQFQRSTTKTETSKQILRNLPFLAPLWLWRLC